MGAASSNQELQHRFAPFGTWLHLFVKAAVPQYSRLFPLTEPQLLQLAKPLTLATRCCRQPKSSSERQQQQQQALPALPSGRHHQTLATSSGCRCTAQDVYRLRCPTAESPRDTAPSSLIKRAPTLSERAQQAAADQIQKANQQLGPSLPLQSCHGPFRAQLPTCWRL